MKSELNVNTHNGALFALGLVCVACYLTQSKSIGDISECVARLTENYVSSGDTKGGKAIERYSLSGALCNAQKGYKRQLDSFLPFYREQLRALGENEARCVTLLKIITEIEDTNLYVRGAKSGAEWAKVQAKSALKSILEGGYDESIILKLDEEFIKRNLSPGGSADMLALVILADKLDLE